MYSYDNLSGLIPTAITGGLVQTVLTHPIVNTLVLPSLLMLVNTTTGVGFYITLPLKLILFIYYILS